MTTRQPIRILMIEDNENDMLMIRDALADRTRYELEWAADLAKGLECLGRARYDVILLDLGLPDSQGVQSIGKINIFFPQIPLVVLTGLDDESEGLDAIRQGAQDYLVKEQVYPGVIRRVIRYAIERKQRLALKDHFVNLLSHELRTPLMVLKELFLLLDMEKVGVLNEAQRKFKEMGVSTIERMDRTASNLLELAKMESGKIVLKKTRFDFNALVTEIADSFEYPIKQKGLELKKKYLGSRLEISADRDKIAQVLTNLFHNAVKFTRAGWIEVSTGESDNRVECRLSDSGPGMAKENLVKIFGKFEQFGETKHKGSGLGLSICKDIIRLHEGEISAESILSQGAVFIFTLPKS